MTDEQIDEMICEVGELNGGNWASLLPDIKQKIRAIVRSYLTDKPELSERVKFVTEQACKFITHGWHAEKKMPERITACISEAERTLAEVENRQK